MMKAHVFVFGLALVLIVGCTGRPKTPGSDIWKAAAERNVNAVKQHIAAGTDINATFVQEGTAGSGGSPLRLAAASGNPDIVRLLIEAGAMLEVKSDDENRSTPLHWAAAPGQLESARLLIGAGADINAKDKNGHTPLDATNALLGGDKAGQQEIAVLLREQEKESRTGSPSANQKQTATEAAGVQRDLPPITAADWSSYNHDVRGWRFNSAEKSLSPDNASKLEEKWHFPTKDSDEKIGAIHATPSIVNGHVYFGTATFPAFYKLKPDGTLAWVYRLKTGEASNKPLPQGGRNTIDAENGILTSALVTYTSVFFGNSAGVFFALDRLTGEELWKIDTRVEGFPNHHPINIFNASAILADGKVIVGGGGYEHPYPLDPNYPCCTGRGFVVALDPSNGNVIWKYEVGEKPRKFPEPVVIDDANGKHVFQYGPSTSSVWSTPSFDAESGTIFFGTDVHNSPRQPTDDDPRLHTRYSAAVIAVDVKTGSEKWVTQINEGDIYNQTMSGYDPETGRYKDCSIGDTPKIYSIEIDGGPVQVVGVGCKNGGFYLLRASDGKLLANTPVFEGKPKYPLTPKADARMIALPSPVGGIQTGCATDGKNVFTNGIDWLLLNTKKPGAPEGGRVVSVSTSLAEERWRHERPGIRSRLYKGGDPVGSGIALGGGIACFTPTVSEQLVVLDAATGKTLKQLQIGTVWSGPSISRGRIYIGTGSILFLKKEITGTLYSFGLPGEDEISRMGAGTE